MGDLLKGVIAGAAAWKLGGGIISTVLIFIVVFFLLGYCQKIHFISVFISLVLEKPCRELTRFNSRLFLFIEMFDLQTV